MISKRAQICLMTIHVLLNLHGTSSASWDPSFHCNSGHHNELDATNRSPNKRTVSWEVALCDIQPTVIRGEWYRFTGVNDDRLTGEAVPNHRCGTVSPIWTNETLPSVPGTGWTINTCLWRDGKPCGMSGKVYAHKCDTFLIYFLQPVPSCPTAYCVGVYTTTATTTPTTTTKDSATTTTTTPTTIPKDSTTTTTTTPTTIPKDSTTTTTTTTATTTKDSTTTTTTRGAAWPYIIG